MPRDVRHPSAVPRWSHRDPAEGGSPFADGDPRREVWDAATLEARRALERCDADIAATARVTLDPDAYREQLVDLALRRFDIWAERGLSVVSDDRGREDYSAVDRRLRGQLARLRRRHLPPRRCRTRAAAPPRRGAETLVGRGAHGGGRRFTRNAAPGARLNGPRRRARGGAGETPIAPAGGERPGRRAHG